MNDKADDDSISLPRFDSKGSLNPISPQFNRHLKADVDLFSPLSQSCYYDYIKYRQGKSLERRRDSFSEMNEAVMKSKLIRPPHVDKPAPHERMFGSKNIEVLGHMLNEEARYAEARANFRSIIASEGSSTHGVYLGMIESCLHEGGDDEAVCTCQQYVINYPRSLQAYTTYIKTLLSIRRFREGVTVCEKALRLFPDNREILQLRGNCFYEQKDYRKAVADFHRTIEITRASTGRSLTAENSLKPWTRNSPFS